MVNLKIRIIDNNDDLYRRIPPTQYYEKESRPSSAAFRDPELSVDWSKYTTPEKTLRGYPSHHLGSFKAIVPRQLSQEVKHNPIPGNYAHSLVIGKKTIAIARKLAKSCKLIVFRKDISG